MASKKASAAKEPAGKSPTVRDRLEKEFLKLLSDIDDQGLIFLLQQANVLVNNARVDRINAEIKELQDSGRPDAAARDPDLVSIEEQSGGKVFFLTIGGARKILSLEELRRIIRICASAETKADALRQLYAVLSRDRNDILLDARIKGAGHPQLDALFALVRSRFIRTPSGFPQAPSGSFPRKD
jgi:hypothetical protein